jgi:tetratricopeptide (TPR) repeat protein
MNERTVVSEDVANGRKLSQRGIGALERGDLVVAESLLNKAVQSNPDDNQARHYHAEALWKAGQHEASLAESQLAYKNGPEDAQLATRLGEQYLFMGQVSNAKKLADEAIDLAPKQSSAWALRARIRRSQGELEDALSDYHRALESDPNNRQLLYESAEIYRQLNKPQRSLAMLGTLRETYVASEEPPQLYALEGAAYLAMGRHNEAIQSLSTVVQRAPSAEAWAALSNAQQKAGLWDNAAESIAQAQRISPQYPGLAEQSKQLGRPAQELRTAQNTSFTTENPVQK